MSGPHPVFFLDEALGRRLLPDILTSAGIRFERHVDHFEPGTPDVDWIPRVAAHGWYALTQDKRISLNPVERNAVLGTGLGVFFLTGASAGMPAVAHNFVTTYPAVERFIRRTLRPFIASVQRGSGSRPGRVEQRWPKA